eukprot:gene3498-3997_t
MEIKSLLFWRAVLAEFVATLLFLFINLSVTLTLNASAPPSITQIALSFGLSIAVLIQIFGSSSGGHINPAVSIGLCLARKISVLRCIFYMIAQCGGAITGAAICYAVTPTAKRGTLGAVALGDGVTRYQGFAVEGILTLILVLTVLASTDEKREDKTFGPALAIGLAVVVCHLIGISFTGCGINPARALAPAVVMTLWPNYHWIYWSGPVVGAVLAAPSYKYLFAIIENPNEQSFDVNKLDAIILENKNLAPSNQTHELGL